MKMDAMARIAIIASQMKRNVDAMVRITIIASQII